MATEESPKTSEGQGSGTQITYAGLIELMRDTFSDPKFEQITNSPLDAAKSLGLEPNPTNKLKIIIALVTMIRYTLVDDLQVPEAGAEEIIRVILRTVRAAHAIDGQPGQSPEGDFPKEV